MLLDFPSTARLWCSAAFLERFFPVCRKDTYARAIRRRIPTTASCAATFRPTSAATIGPRPPAQRGVRMREHHRESPERRAQRRRRRLLCRDERHARDRDRDVRRRHRHVNEVNHKPFNVRGSRRRSNIRYRPNWISKIIIPRRPALSIYDQYIRKARGAGPCAPDLP